MEFDTTLALWVVGGLLGAWAFLVAAIAAYLSWIMAKPAPKGGTDYKLPNGMVIKQWQELETKFLFQEIFGSDSAYSRDGLQFAPGQTIVDAGANIGMFTLFAAKATRGHARILSFEPIPSTHSVLAANCVAAAEGKFDDVFKPAPGAQLRISALRLGLSDGPASVTFEHSPHLSIWSARDPAFVEERKRRFAADLKLGMSKASFLVQLLMPSWVVSLLVGVFVRNMAATVPVPATLVTLSSIIDEQQLPVIDLLKVDVEGSEEAVLRGIRPEHWPRIQQVVLEVENFAAVRAIKGALEARGFAVTHFASERDKHPGAQSEVSMMYAVRPGYKPAAVGTAATAAKAPAAKAPVATATKPASAVKAGRGRSNSRGAAAKSPAAAPKGKSPSPAARRRSAK